MKRNLSLKKRKILISKNKQNSSKYRRAFPRERSSFDFTGQILGKYCKIQIIVSFMLKSDYNKIDHGYDIKTTSIY